MQDEFLRLQALLKKTIVFITHDFDEALRLADRIAIMFEGKVEQIDQPGNIVLNPATDYVAKFTNDVPREKVLTVKDIMEEKKEKESLVSKSVNLNDRVEIVAEYILSQNTAVPVADENNKLVGVLHPDKVLKILFPEKAK